MKRGRSNGGREAAIRKLALPQPTVLRGFCSRIRARARARVRNCTRDVCIYIYIYVCVYVCVCGTPPSSSFACVCVCVARGERERRETRREREQATGAADSLCPRKLCSSSSSSSPRLCVFPPSPPPHPPSCLPSLSPRPSSGRPLGAPASHLCARSAITFLSLSLSLPRSFPLARYSAESVPSRASATLLPLLLLLLLGVSSSPRISATRSPGCESSQPDAHTGPA